MSTTTSILIILSCLTFPSFGQDDYDSGAVCYFPIEYQGSFLIQEQSQTLTDGDGISVSYSEITIEADMTPPWGRCHSRRGNIVILRDSNGPQDCLRCLHLSLKTPNVIQIHSEGLGRCYTNEGAARAKCPTDRDVRESRTFKEIILFRKHVPGGLQSVEHQFCPFNGRYRFNYVSHGGRSGLQCESPLNEVGNCPHGDALNIRFKGCPFSNLDVNFLCLGDWDHPSSAVTDRYVALMDLREKPDSVPKYRCGLFREEASTKRIYLSLSSDSTCSTHLKSATSGYESFILTPETEKVIPPLVEASRCRFPDWTQSKWQSSVVDGSTFTFKDDRDNFSTLTSRCILRQTSTPQERFVVFTRSQCQEDSYRCLWFKRRSPNILEFQFGQESSPFYSDNLCDDRHFITNNWITQGRKAIQSQTQCPIIGDYSGVIPQSNGLCAKVASDCNNPDIMFYTVTSCDNRSHVLEERSYRCLGNWEEDNILYAYTERMDMPGHQCFAGKIFRSGEEVFIKEAGESCIRGDDPLLFGMNITKEAPCPRLTPSYLMPSRRPPTSSSTTTSTTKPIVFFPSSSSSSSTGSRSPSSSFSPSSVADSSSSSSSAGDDHHHHQQQQQQKRILSGFLHPNNNHHRMMQPSSSPPPPLMSTSSPTSTSPPPMFRPPTSSSSSGQPNHPPLRDPYWYQAESPSSSSSKSWKSPRGHPGQLSNFNPSFYTPPPPPPPTSSSPASSASSSFILTLSLLMMMVMRRL